MEAWLNKELDFVESFIKDCSFYLQSHTLTHETVDSYIASRYDGLVQAVTTQNSERL